MHLQGPSKRNSDAPQKIHARRLEDLVRRLAAPNCYTANGKRSQAREFSACCCQQKFVGLTQSTFHENEKTVFVSFSILAVLGTKTKRKQTVFFTVFFSFSLTGAALGMRTKTQRQRSSPSPAHLGPKIIAFISFGSLEIVIATNLQTFAFARFWEPRGPITLVFVRFWEP